MSATLTERTRDEIDDLKRSWHSDSCWDIEDTEGFEAHQAELLAFREQSQAEWASHRQSFLESLADRLGCPGNLKLAEYIDNLEESIDRLYKARQ